jgi:hypothetical protein
MASSGVRAATLVAKKDTTAERLRRSRSRCQRKTGHREYHQHRQVPQDSQENHFFLLSFEQVFKLAGDSYRYGKPSLV